MIKNLIKNKRLLVILATLVTVACGFAVVLRSCNSSDRATTPTTNTSSPVESPTTVPQPTSPNTQRTQIPASSPSAILSSSNLQLENEPTAVPSWFKQKSLAMPNRDPAKWGELIVYTPAQPPQFIPDPQLQVIVNDILTKVRSKSLPTNNLSITLIDANTKKFAGYQQEKPFFPASIAKMFWLTVLHGQIQHGMWTNPSAFDPFITKMMKESDNDSSSFIIDRITNTHSSKIDLNPQEFQIWLAKRKFYINLFFQQAGYQSVNLTQKTYPIPYLDFQEPKGNELQVRLEPNNPAKKPIRNQVSTMDAARLMYEICHSKQALSVQLSTRMCGFLKKDINPKSWKSISKDDFNPIETFFGEPLSYKNTELFSKAGWTPSSRQEVAMVRMSDSRQEYILAIFADDPNYGKDKTIFPEISKLVYQKLHRIR